MKPGKSTGQTGFLSGKTGDAARPWKEGTENFGIIFRTLFFVITPVFEWSCSLPLCLPRPPQMDAFRKSRAPTTIITTVKALRAARQIRGWMADVPRRP